MTREAQARRLAIDAANGHQILLVVPWQWSMHFRTVGRLPGMIGDDNPRQFVDDRACSHVVLPVMLRSRVLSRVRLLAVLVPPRLEGTAARALKCHRCILGLRRPFRSVTGKSRFGR